MYKLGKLPARKGAITFKLATFGAQLPDPPQSYGHYKLLGPDWHMLGNDQYGDCVWAGAAHEHMLWNKEATRDVAFSDDNVLQSYSAVTGFNPNDPATDQGTDMQQAASYRRKVGMPDHAGDVHKVGAYLAIDVRNERQLKQAISTFSAVGIGLMFPDSAMQQFFNKKPWTIQKGAQIIGGHYVSAVGYSSRYLYVVTWGRLQAMSWGFFRKYNDESIAYLSEEMLTNGKSIDGFDLNALKTYLSQL